MKGLVLSFTILSLISFDALADTPSFDFIEAGYLNPFRTDDLDGYELNGSFELNESFYLNTRYLSEGDKSVIDTDSYFFGVGYKRKLSNSSVWFTQINYVKVNSEINLPEFDRYSTNNGYQLSLGVKTNISEQWELSAVNFLDIDSRASVIELGALYHFTKNAGLYLKVDSEFEQSTFATGLRISF
jgi:hypothetical protein